MDAKGIWNTTITRTINSSTYKVIMTSTPSRRGQNLKSTSARNKKKFAHNATKVVSTGRATKKTMYWDQRSGSWKSSKNAPVNVGLKKDYKKTQYKTKKNFELSKKNRNEESEKKLKEIKDTKYTSTGKLKIKGEGAHRTWDRKPGNEAVPGEGRKKTTFTNKNQNSESTDGQVTKEQLDAKVKELKLKNKYKQLSEEDKNKAVENFKKNYEIKDTETGFNVKQKKDAPNPEYYKKKDNKEEPSNKLKAGPKKYGNAPKGYIKAGNKFASLKSVKGKRAAMKADRLKILQKKILDKKKKKKES